MYFNQHNINELKYLDKKHFLLYYLNIGFQKGSEKMQFPILAFLPLPLLMVLEQVQQAIEQYIDLIL